MVIRTAKFVASYPSVQKCPITDLPEYAFIGRSNVGKSSLINMLTGTKTLAKVSQTPGKTQYINYYLINSSWHLVDLPGYGYAKTSKGEREKLSNIVLNYILKRENLHLLFVLIDSRLEPQDIDIQFINWLGVNHVPFALIFTKTDKVSGTVLERNIELHKTILLETWDELPPIFTTSCVTRTGREDVLNYIESVFQEVKITHYQM